MMTIASDDEVEAEGDTESDSEAAAGVAVAKPALTKAGKKRQRQKGRPGKNAQKEGPVDPTFSFDVESSLGVAESQAVRGWDFKSEQPSCITT